MDLRRILAVLVGIGLVLLVFVLVIKGITGHKSGSAPSNDVNISQLANTNAVSQLYIDGPINLDQDHRTVKVSVSQTQTQVDVIQGYQGNVIASRSYPNNQAGYAVFLQALKLQSFSKGNSSPSARDERGFCPTGERYIYSIAKDSTNIFRYWSSSCGGGTFGGKSTTVRQLFIRQIPSADFNKLTSGIPLG